MMTLELDEVEIAAIVQVLGQLPTNTGAYPLLVKIQQQLEAAKKATVTE